MSWSLWLALLFATVVISMTPGAGAVNTMTNSMSQGWRRSVWGIVGQQLALVVHLLIVAAGVGLIVQQNPLILEIVRYLGAAYLVYLGVRLMLARVEERDESVPKTRAREGAWPMLRRGFWVNLLNPKAILFFLAFVPQFIKNDQPQLPQYLTLIVTIIVVDVVVMWFFFAAAAKPLQKFTTTACGQRIMNRIFGALFIAVAGLLVFVH